MPKMAVDGHGNKFLILEAHEIPTEITNAITSVPPDGAKKKVTNLYVEMVEGQPKLRVEYEE